MIKNSNQLKGESIKRVIGDEIAFKVSGDLNININSIYIEKLCYKEYSEQPCVMSGHAHPKNEEIHKLQKQICALQEENKILKKAGAVFVKNLSVNS